MLLGSDAGGVGGLGIDSTGTSAMAWNGLSLGVSRSQEAIIGEYLPEGALGDKGAAPCGSRGRGTSSQRLAEPFGDLYGDMAWLRNGTETVQ